MDKISVNSKVESTAIGFDTSAWKRNTQVTLALLSVKITIISFPRKPWIADDDGAMTVKEISDGRGLAAVRHNWVC